jgi:TetR/AcrR family transcriptional regulator
MSDTTAEATDRPSKSDRTKDSILIAAERLFSENGFDATSLDAIGDDVGIQGTAILYHYSTKRDLYEAVLDRIFTPFVDEIGALLETEGPLEDRLVAITSAMVRYAARRPGAARLILRETSAGSADVKEIMGSAVAPHWKRSVEVLESKPDGDVVVDPLMVWNIIIGAVCFYYAAGPTIGGLSYDPSEPQRTAAFEAVMMDMTRSLCAGRPAT